MNDNMADAPWRGADKCRFNYLHGRFRPSWPFVTKQCLRYAQFKLSVAVVLNLSVKSDNCVFAQCFLNYNTVPALATRKQRLSVIALNYLRSGSGIIVSDDFSTEDDALFNFFLIHSESGRAPSAFAFRSNSLRSSGVTRIDKTSCLRSDFFSFGRPGPLFMQKLTMRFNFVIRLLKILSINVIRLL